MNTRRALSVAAFAAIGLVSAFAAQANVISGRLWHVPEAVTFLAVPANVPVTTPDVTFDVNSPMNFNATNATISTWLASSAAFNIVENTRGNAGRADGQRRDGHDPRVHGIRDGRHGPDVHRHA